MPSKAAKAEWTRSLPDGAVVLESEPVLCDRSADTVSLRSISNPYCAFPAACLGGLPTVAPRVVQTAGNHS